jgi:hypothetical protein
MSSSTAITMQVVDVGEGAKVEPYRWVLEFQCVPAQGSGETGIAFIGINFYARKPDHSLLPEVRHGGEML